MPAMIIFQSHVKSLSVGKKSTLAVCMFTVFTTLLKLAQLTQTESVEGSCCRPGPLESVTRPAWVGSEGPGQDWAVCVLHVSFGYISDFWSRFLIGSVNHLSFLILGSTVFFSIRRVHGELCLKSAMLYFEACP